MPTNAPLHRKLRMGLVGGGQGAFIGRVHAIAGVLDNRAALVAGALSSDPAKAMNACMALFLMVSSTHIVGTCPVVGTSPRSIQSETSPREIAGMVRALTGFRQASRISVSAPWYRHAPWRRHARSGW